MKGKTIFFVAVLVNVLILTGAFAAQPDNHCYRLAANKDKALENMDGVLQGSGNRINPCTGLKDSANTYYDLKGGVTQIRTVYGNGDAEGYIGLNRYRVCHSSGTARIIQRIYGPGSSSGKTPWAWGFWFNFPFDDDPSTWIKDKELCNTIE